MSFAELARRGIEHMTTVWNGKGEEEWKFPEPISLGWTGLSDAELKRLAQEEDPVL